MRCGNYLARALAALGSRRRAPSRPFHGGLSLAVGRNALVALAAIVDGLLPPSGAADLLGFALLAGSDPEGSGLGIPRAPAPWDGFETNVATVKRAGEALALAINVRAAPTLQGDALRAHLERQVIAYDERTGAALAASGRFSSRALVIDPESKLVKRLLAAYARATGREAAPATSAGGTYAKHLPRAIAFGMWFREDGTYPGHGADEYIPVASLHRGTHVLIEALADLACGPRIDDPFAR